MIKKPIKLNKIYNLLIIAFFLILVAQLFSHQIINGATHEEIARRNFVRIRRIEAKRGMILDERLRPIVTNRPSINLYFRPNLIRDRQAFFDLLTEHLDVTREHLERLIFENRFRAFNEILIAENMQEGTLANIAESMTFFPELSIRVEILRHYTIPNHFTGYVGRINEQEFRRFRDQDYTMNSLIGKTGIERQYEGLLAGRSGYEILQVDALGQNLGLFKNDLYRRPINGFNVVLTINLELQEFIHSIFPRDKAGAVVVINPQTGGILSYNSFPEFDQNWFAEGITQAQWDYLRNHEMRPLLDRVVLGTYPPGSTFKTVTAAFAFEKNYIAETTRLAFCGGGLQIGDRFFRCWQRHGHGRTSFFNAMAMSCNVYFYDLSSRFSLDEFVAFSWNNHLFDRTGIDLPSERTGFMPNTEWFRNRLGRFISTLGIRANFAIGQGEVLVSPLAMGAYFAAIASDGVWRTPHLFKEAFNDNRTIAQDILTKQEKHLPYSENTMRLIQQSLHYSVYSDTGTGRHVRVRGAEIYAKTGTSENPHGELPHALIGGYAKWDNLPEIAFFIIIENAGFGGGQAGPVARQIIQFYQDRIRPTNAQIARGN